MNTARFLIFALLVGLTEFAAAQQALDPMTPDLALSFPLTTSPDGVTVKYPVLMNAFSNGVVEPGTILISIYQPLHPNNAPADFGLIQHADAQKAYSRDTRTGDEQATVSREDAQQISTAKRNPWMVTNNFILAMEQISVEEMHLICRKQAGVHVRYWEETFQFFDGMFIGLPNGKITVLSVVNSSPAASGGIVAGDQITAVGGTPVSTLQDFVKAFDATKTDAEDYKKPNYSLKIVSQGTAKDVAVPMPPRFDFNSYSSPNTFKAPVGPSGK